MSKTIVRPFLQWPGGKAKVAPLILPHFKLPAKKFIEPLCGAAAISLAVATKGGAEEFWINDINSDLINLFRWATAKYDRLDNLIGLAKREFFDDLNGKDGSHYYCVRDAFNRSGRRHNGLLEAAWFFYLDFHCYNALIRYNSKGEFNSPYRKDRKIAAFPEQAIRNFARLIRNATFTCQDFKKVMDQCDSGDVVYCDPPYVPLSKTANFTTYSRGGFGMKEQTRLVEAARAAQQRGAQVIISNHDTPAARELYADATEIISLEVMRSISCKSASRGSVKELIAIYESVKGVTK